MSAGVIEREMPARMPQTRTPRVRRESSTGFKCQISSTSATRRKNHRSCRWLLRIPRKSYALERFWKRVAERGRPEEVVGDIEQRRRDTASLRFRGVDKDSFLTKVSKAYMAIIGDGRGGIFCEDALAEPKDWHAEYQGSHKSLERLISW